MPKGTISCKMCSEDGYCPKPLEMVSAYLSKKWTISVIITIGNFGTLRFQHLQHKMEGITPKMLTQRLRELAKEGIIKREEFAEIPPRVEYSLTKKGKQLRKALIPMINWSEKQKNS